MTDEQRIDIAELRRIEGHLKLRLSRPRKATGLTSELAGHYANVAQRARKLADALEALETK